MKKVISILLAVATMAFATSAMAAVGTSGLTGYKNSSTVVLTDTYSTASMPCFRPGNTVTFNITGVNNGEEITLVTYKYSADLSNTTVQYINQYTAEGSTQAVTYVVRDLDPGVYQIDINASRTAGVYTVYYKIGDVSASIVPGTNGANKPYYIENNGDGTYSLGFVGKVTINTADIALADIGSKPGFTITNGSKTKSYKFGTGNNSALTAGTTLISDDAEIEGGYSFVYGMTIQNVASANVSAFSATALTGLAEVDN